MAIALRNGGAGLAVHPRLARRAYDRRDAAAGRAASPTPSLDDFRRQQLDLYIPAGEKRGMAGRDARPRRARRSARCVDAIAHRRA